MKQTRLRRWGAQFDMLLALAIMVVSTLILFTAVLIANNHIFVLGAVTYAMSIGLFVFSFARATRAWERITRNDYKI